MNNIVLNIRLPRIMKDSFSDCCKIDDTTVSREIRRLISNYLFERGIQNAKAKNDPEKEQTELFKTCE